VIHIGDCRNILPTLAPGSFRTCVTSPPYWGLRDYGHHDQIGLEPTPEAYVETMVAVFRAVRRVLADDGTLWLNLGDSYATSGGAGTQGASGQRADRRYTAEGASAKGVPPGLKPKDLVGIPWRVAFALQADGWWLRSDIVWHKSNPMPESVTDRPTKAHEFVFLLSKSERYYYDAEAIKEPVSGLVTDRNRRDVWTVPSQPYAGAHFATMPEALVTPCILAGSAPGDAVLDPFLGSGTVGQVAERLGRRWAGCELNPEYEALAKARTAQRGFVLGVVQ
jgi:site-specific DNA-methyltransferase (cytosine-N4-specific)